MFGPLLIIPFIRYFLKLPNNPLKFLLTGINYGIPCIFAFFCLTLALRPREVINPFPDLPKLSFDSEDFIFILYRLSNFNKMSRVIYLSLPFIYMCFLTLQQPQSFIFTSVNSPTVKFPSHNVFRVEKPL